MAIRDDRLCRFRSNSRNFCSLAKLASRAHRLQCARNHLRRTCPARIIERLRFEEFSVRQDDAELIVQTMKHLAEVGLHRYRWYEVVHVQGSNHAWEPGVRA